MGKSHRDNHKARLKAEANGIPAFRLKQLRRAKVACNERVKCRLCGNVRILVEGTMVCNRCVRAFEELSGCGAIG